MSHIPQRFAWLLAVLAVLFVCGTQVLEVGHSHMAESSAEGCLLCSGVTSAALPRTFISPMLRVSLDQPIVGGVPQSRTSLACFNAPRGPPLIS
jgi:hypothetical protein